MRGDGVVLPGRGARPGILNARGWIVAKTGWSEGPAISHDGSNTMNYCSVWAAPEAGAAVAAFTNRGPTEEDREILKKWIEELS